MQHKQSQVSDCISYPWVIVIRDTHFTDLRVFLSSNNDVRNALHSVFIDGIATQDVSPIYKYDTMQSSIEKGLIQWNGLLLASHNMG